MTLETDRFGVIDLEHNKIINFPQGLPGFEELRGFVILEIEESRPIYWLQSIENAYIALPVVIPFEFMQDYFVEIRDSELEELEISDKHDLLILNVVMIPENVSGMTANLAAPVIVNLAKGLGKQIIIDAKELPIKFPIFEMIMNKLKGGGEDAGAVAQKG